MYYISVKIGIFMRDILYLFVKKKILTKKEQDNIIKCA